MKRRYIISAISTIILLIFTNKLWLIWNNHHHRLYFYTFFIILILGYLASVKITSYLAEFKTLKNHSRIEIIFLTIFFIMLFIPMSHINNAKISKRENRTLAVWKPFIQKHKINYEFGKDFDNWFNDRFYQRTILTTLHLFLKYNIPSKYYETEQGYLNKQNGWLSNVKKYPQLNNFSEEEKLLTLQELQKLKKFCDKNNIKLYIIIAPRKEEICEKELAPFIGKFSTFTKTKNMIEYLESKNIEIPIIYPYEELEKYQSTTQKAYFKTDHHWTDDSAYTTTYNKLLKTIEKDFSNVKILHDNDFKYTYSKKVRVNPGEGYHTGRTYQTLNLHDEKLLDTNYKYYNYKHFKKPPTHKYVYVNDNTRYHRYEYLTDNKYKMLLFGDSFTLNLMNTLGASFANSRILYTWSTGNEEVFNLNKITYQDEIYNMKPDMIIICLSGISKLQYLYLTEH